MDAGGRRSAGSRCAHFAVSLTLLWRASDVCAQQRAALRRPGGAPLSAPRGRLLPLPHSTQVSHTSGRRQQSSPWPPSAPPRNRRSQALQGSEAQRPVTSASGLIRAGWSPAVPAPDLPRPQALGLREKAGPQVLRSPDNPRPHLGAPGASSAPQPWAGQLNQPAHSAGFPPSTLGERGKYSQEIKSSHGIPCRVPGSCPHNPRH